MREIRRKRGARLRSLVSVRIIYIQIDGTGRNMEVTADEVEFLSPKGERSEVNDNPAENEFIRVDDEELPSKLTGFLFTEKSG